MTDLSSINLAALRSVDSVPIVDTSIDDLDLDQVAAHIAGAIERGRYTGPTEPQAYLRARNCVAERDGALCCTAGGLLCFGRAVQRFFPRAVIDIGHYRGLEPLSYEVIHLEKDINGTVFDQLQRVESYVWQNIHHGMTLSDRGFQRVEVHEYPRAVIRELGVNMIAHRDYFNFRSASRIHLFRNRIEWISPGGLPPGITVDNILHEQAARNPVVLSVMYERGLLEAFGQGLNTVVAELEREHMPPPAFFDTGASFIVTVHGRPLDLFYGGSAYRQLNESQQRILTLLRSNNGLTPREIGSLMPDRARRSISRDLSGLTESNLIVAIGEGRALRYYLNPTEIPDTE